MSAAMQAVFPDALTPLRECDPEVYGLIQEEKSRQWCAFRARPAARLARRARSAATAAAAEQQTRQAGFRARSTLCLLRFPSAGLALTGCLASAPVAPAARALSSLPARTLPRRL